MRAKTAVVLGAQWGDEGKGKIVDVLSERFTAVARYAGGHNAGHTVIIGDQKFVLQLIPCGVLRPGCRGIIGNGVVLDPIAFLKEVAKLRALDQIAYIRFASVYQSFEDLETLKREVDNLYSQRESGATVK